MLHAREIARREAGHVHVEHAVALRDEDGIDGVPDQQLRGSRPAPPWRSCTSQPAIAIAAHRRLDETAALGLGAPAQLQDDGFGTVCDRRAAEPPNGQRNDQRYTDQNEDRLLNPHCGGDAEPGNPTSTVRLRRTPAFCGTADQHDEVLLEKHLFRTDAFKATCGIRATGLASCSPLVPRARRRCRPIAGG